MKTFTHQGELKEAVTLDFTDRYSLTLVANTEIVIVVTVNDLAAENARLREAINEALKITERPDEVVMILEAALGGE